jgi:hypothetical protein
MKRKTAAKPNGSNKLKANTRAKPGANTRAKPGANTRAKPGANTRAKPGANTRAKPGANTRAKPGAGAKKEGGQAGNANATRHGFYGDLFTEPELALCAAFMDPSLNDETSMQRVLNRRLMAHANLKDESSAGLMFVCRQREFARGGHLGLWIAPLLH